MDSSGLHSSLTNRWVGLSECLRLRGLPAAAAATGVARQDNPIQDKGCGARRKSEEGGGEGDGGGGVCIHAEL